MSYLENIMEALAAQLVEARTVKVKDKVVPYVNFLNNMNPDVHKKVTLNPKFSVSMSTQEFVDLYIKVEEESNE